MRIGLFIGGFYTIERVYSPNYKKPDKFPCVIVANHLSMIDICFILSEFGVTSFVAHVSVIFLKSEWIKETLSLWFLDGTN